MNGLAFGVGAALLGTVAHIALLRHLPTRWRLVVLPPLLLIALACLALFVPGPGGKLDAEDIAVALVLTLSLGFGYALISAGVVYDSPTLAIVNEIESYGSAGMPISEFKALAAAHPFVRSRLDALIAVRELGADNDDLLLIGRTVFLLQLGDAYRRIRGGRNFEAG
jgi:hypothetical protein